MLIEPLAAPILSSKLSAPRNLLNSSSRTSQDESDVDPCPIEHLLLLRGRRGIPFAVRPLPPALRQLRSRCDFALDTIARPLAERHRASLLESLPERERFIEAGYRYEEDMLLAMRVMKAADARRGIAKLPRSWSESRNASDHSKT